MTLELLTYSELAYRLKVSVKTVRRLVAAGLIPAKQVGGRHRFYWSDVLGALPASGAARSARRLPPLAGRPDMIAYLKEKAAHHYAHPVDELAQRRAQRRTT